MQKVSVVIPFYSHIDWLIEAVESVFAQDYPNFEVIVINDGSGEDDREFLQKYGSRILYEKNANYGAASARNRGIELASGEYIAFLDSDDLWMPDKLSVQVRGMCQSDAKWSYCNYSTFGGEKKICRMSKANTIVMQKYYSPNIATPCVMICKECLAEDEGCRFNASLRYGEDSYLWLMLNSKYPILSIPQELVKVRIRGNNAAKRARAQLEGRGRLWKCRMENPRRLIEPFEESRLFRFASRLCTIGETVVVTMEKAVHNNDVIELLSRILFVVPWILFKIDRKRKKNNEWKVDV